MKSQNHTIHNVDKALVELEVPGPNGLKLRFTEPKMGLYGKAEVLQRDYPPTHIKVHSNSPNIIELIDGGSADGDNHLYKFRASKNLDWSLRVWSSDASYVVLTTYILNNGKVDLRNTRAMNAYDKKTGELTHFAAKTATLGGDAFDMWSPALPSIALLWGVSSSLEAAHASQQ